MATRPEEIPEMGKQSSDVEPTRNFTRLAIDDHGDGLAHWDAGSGSRGFGFKR